MTTEKIPYQVIKIAEWLRDAKPWSGSFGERCDKFKLTNILMNRFYRRRVHLRFDIESSIMRWSNSGASSYNSASETITLRGRLSVITFFHEWGHALGMNEDGANAWSDEIFKRVFPTENSKLKKLGTMLVKESG